jgi:GH25 family lysozyme M1 (1,4-beta-N-acetylmuramidase)
VLVEETECERQYLDPWLNWPPIRRVHGSPFARTRRLHWKRACSLRFRTFPMKRPVLLPSILLLAFCILASSALSLGAMPQIINVSSYDPKEKQRSGVSYSEYDVSALRANGASGLIARAGKGGSLDEKCATFLASADRAGMLPGVYYRLHPRVDAVKQADQFVSRAQALARSRAWNANSLLLCADFDANSRMSDILRFMGRVESRTGVVPVAYLENSTHLKLLLSSADRATKAKLRQMPYWLALYSHDKGGSPQFPTPGDPRGLVKQYDVWSDWTLWQYGGVDWRHGRSQPRVYCHGSHRFPLYFGKMDRPMERNVFNGSHASLQAFWQRHGLRLK